MKKFLKSLTGVAVIGAAVGACVYFFTKKKDTEVSDEDIIDMPEDDDVADGEPASRTYATLNTEPAEEFGEVEDAPAADEAVEDAESEEAAATDDTIESEDDDLK